MVAVLRLRVELRDVEELTVAEFAEQKGSVLPNRHLLIDAAKPGASRCLLDDLLIRPYSRQNGCYTLVPEK